MKEHFRETVTENDKEETGLMDGIKKERSKESLKEKNSHAC